MNVGPDPRMNIIFRIRCARDGDPNEGMLGHHGTDHPDRGAAKFEDGQIKPVFLDYPDGYDPWEISKRFLCDVSLARSGQLGLRFDTFSFPLLTLV